MHDTLFRTIERLKDTIETYCPQGEEYQQAEALLRVIDDSRKVIKPGTDRVINIVRRLRSFARLDEALLKTVDIHEGLEDTLTLIHHELKHNITVKRNYDEIPPIACFPGQLNQVFLNILINAKQAIRGEGEITIDTFVQGDKAHIAITDTGIGIPKHHLDKIFDPGFTTKGVGVGTGLGLSICYQIIQDHLGEIRVESEIGKGTTFMIIIPTDLERLLNEAKAARGKVAALHPSDR
jgi:signal transduction histidine kinase